MKTPKKPRNKKTDKAFNDALKEVIAIGNKKWKDRTELDVAAIIATMDEKVEPFKPTPSNYNISMCDNCGDVIWSKNRHDYVSCKCGAIFADGGYDYKRGGGKDLGVILYFDGETFTFKQFGTNKVRHDTAETLALLAGVLTWGSYGKDGKGPKVTKPLNQLDIEHVVAICQTQPHLDEVYSKVFKHILAVDALRMIDEMRSLLDPL